MSSIAEKSAFLKYQYLPLIKTIAVDTVPVFGKMNAQQMIEHMAAAIRSGYGNPIITTILTPEENIPKMQAFVLSDKPFKDNTPNALMSEIPAPALFSSIELSIIDLEKSVAELFDAFDKDQDLQVINPFFGVLDADKTMSLLYKHALHHLRQFGVSVQ